MTRMTAPRRFVLRLSLATLLVVASMSGVTLDGVDHRPYMSSAYGSETAARLRESIQRTVVVRGDLEAGFGRARLTPTINAERDDPARGQFRSMPLAGFGERDGHPAAGTHDDLEVKAVALRVAGQVGVMVGADALIIPPEVTEAVMHRVESELHLSRQQVYLSATHSHCSLGGWGEGRVAESFAGGFQPGVRAWFADRIVTAIAQSLHDLAPAEFGQGPFDAPEFVRNRLVQERGTVDTEFSFLVVKQMGGRLGVLGSYSAHATVLSAAVMEFSADYPGVVAARRRVRDGRYRGIPGWWRRQSWTGDPHPGFERRAAMGEGLARRLLDELPKVPLSRQVAFAHIRLGGRRFRS